MEDGPSGIGAGTLGNKKESGPETVNLVCPTAFKGTFTPLEAARRLARPGDRLLPLSDGGDGFLECLLHRLGGEPRWTRTEDPFRRTISVPVLVLPDGTVVIESAKAIGLAGLEEQDPMRASSRGLGDLIAQFAEAPRLWIGLGGTATVDGGCDWPSLKLPPTVTFCDVRTELRNAARIFGPQKGAKPQDIPILTERLRSLGLPEGPRSGAAGGLGAKLLSLGAELVDGAEKMMDVLCFEEACQGCDAVITGEGRLDASTLEGKLPLAVAKRARALGLPVIGHFGSRGLGWESVASHFDEIRFDTDSRPKEQNHHTEESGDAEVSRERHSLS